MSLLHSWSPTLGQRKSPLSERQTLQTNLEEKRLFPRSTGSASHSRCTQAAALLPAEPSQAGLWVPGLTTCPEYSHGGSPSHTFPERSPLPAAPADPHGESLPGPPALRRGSDGLGKKGDTLGAGVRRGGRAKWVFTGLELAQKWSCLAWGRVD